MVNSKEGKLDPITFVYGVGAAIVLIGAMFKFLGWQYANELFILGLSVEVVVFLISAFERQSKDKEYQWENVFPQLQATDNEQSMESVGLGDAVSQFTTTLNQLNMQMQEMGSSIQQIRSEMELNIKGTAQMHQSLEEFNQQMDVYNSNMQRINDKYNSLLSQNQQAG